MTVDDIRAFGMIPEFIGRLPIIYTLDGLNEDMLVQVEANPGAVDSFLQNYAASVEWVNANNADAAQLIAEYGIIEAGL